jgi:hypothetical protein
VRSRIEKYYPVAHAGVIETYGKGKTVSAPVFPAIGSPKMSPYFPTSEKRPGNVWQTIEIPRLMENPDVTRIVQIDPDTGQPITIFERRK